MVRPDRKAAKWSKVERLRDLPDQRWLIEDAAPSRVALVSFATDNGETLSYYQTRNYFARCCRLVADQAGPGKLLLRVPGGMSLQRLQELAEQCPVTCSITEEHPR